MAVTTFAQQGMIRRRRESTLLEYKEESKSDTVNINNDRRSPSLSESGQNRDDALHEFWERFLMVQPLDVGSLSMSMPTGYYAHEKAWPRRSASSADVNEIDAPCHHHNHRLLVVDDVLLP